MGAVYGTHIVYLNGLMQREGEDYNYNGAQGKIQFANPPGNTSKVDIYGVNASDYATVINTPSL